MELTRWPSTRCVARRKAGQEAALSIDQALLNICLQPNCFDSGYGVKTVTLIPGQFPQHIWPQHVRDAWHMVVFKPGRWYQRCR